MHEKRSEQPERNLAAAWPSVTRESLAAFLDLSPDALIAVDATGTIMLMNARMETLFGYRQDELADQPLETVIPERLRAAHAARRAQYMQATRPRPIGVGLPLVGRRKDGSESPVDINLRPVLVGQALHVIGAVRDMTAQRLAEQGRMQISERLRQQDQLLHLSHDAIPVRDPASHVISWNEGAAKLYGWTVQEVEGKVTHTLLQTRFPISQEEISQILEQDGQWEGELAHTCRDGRQVTVESRQALVRDHNGTPSAILEINRDVTERHHLAQQAHLFGCFVRARNARASGISGTGLDLYLCRELIEQHEGQICFESEEEAGSTFFFSLPCTGEIG